MEPLRLLLRAEKSLTYTFAVERGEIVIGDTFDSRMPELHDFVATSRSLERGWSAYDASRPERAQRNRALRHADLRRLRGGHGALVESPHWKRWGLSGRDQLRVLVCDGPAALAWVGAFQPGPFDVSQRRSLQRIVPALTRRLTLEHRLHQGEIARATVSAALENIGAAAFIVSANGRVDHANIAGRALLEQDRNATMVRLFTGISQQSHGFTKLSVNGLPPSYLAILSAPQTKTHAAIAAHRWELTARQRQVLDLLVEGKSNVVIAACLKVSVRTVEVHASAIYARAGVEGRAELVARMLDFAQ
jgi:DNA-binding NarL/FixJ family response regulator